MKKISVRSELDEVLRLAADAADDWYQSEDAATIRRGKDFRKALNKFHRKWAEKKEQEIKAKSSGFRYHLRRLTKPLGKWYEGKIAEPVYEKVLRPAKRYLRHHGFRNRFTASKGAYSTSTYDSQWLPSHYGD